MRKTLIMPAYLPDNKQLEDLIMVAYEVQRNLKDQAPPCPVTQFFIDQATAELRRREQPIRRLTDGQ